MPKYDHAYSISFSLESNHPTGDDVTNGMIARALLSRINDCLNHSDSELIECVGHPYDTYKIEK